MYKNFILSSHDVDLEVIHNQKPQSVNHILFLIGLDENDQVYLDQAKDLKNSYCVLARLRGSGKSNSPKENYKASDFANDIRYIFLNLKLNNPIIVMSGLTSVYCLKFLLDHNVEVKGLIFINNGASSIPLNDEWLEQFHKRPSSYLSKVAAIGLSIDSEFINLYPELFRLKASITLMISKDSINQSTDYEVLDFKRFHDHVAIKELPHSEKYINESDRVILNKTILEMQNVI
jgi:pimeloyl-ACP methyl ester carboxylesterase